MARDGSGFPSGSGDADGGGVAATTEELHRQLLRLHLEPTFGGQYVNAISPAKVRTWRAERRKATGAATTAKSYRLLKAILQTAVEDDLIRRNPCFIRGAGPEDAYERPMATVEQVSALAKAIGIRWRLMVLLGAFASMCPEELAELRQSDIDPDTGSVRIRRAAPELNTGRRVIGDPKSRAGKREIMLPGFILLDVRRHLEWFAQDGPEAHQRKLAADIDADVRPQHAATTRGREGCARLPPFTSSRPRSGRRRKAHEGSDVDHSACVLIFESARYRVVAGCASELNPTSRCGAYGTRARRGLDNKQGPGLRPGPSSWSG
ncbi:hypothetical protein ACFU98_36385 [Streptomyces sp. NPDC057575]|uniref:hypothetical protein n=1 Tax=unclassified Streptomyces TaxID=2593676 RepID=UPI0036C09408